MDTMTLHTSSEAATESCGVALASFLEPDDVLVLSGDLGAGKTHLSKGIGAGLGVADAVTSPTFNILLAHEGRLPLFHFDLYRLEDADQLEDIDYWGTLESGGVSVVEWGDRFDEALPPDGLLVRLHITGDDDRAIEVRPLGSRGTALADAWGASCAGLPGVRVTGGER